MYTIIEALADGSVKQGVPRQMAIQFAAQTLLGAAKTVLQTGKHPAVLRDEVRKRRKIIFLSTTDICRETQSTYVYKLHQYFKDFVSILETHFHSNCLEGSRYCLNFLNKTKNLNAPQCRIYRFIIQESHSLMNLPDYTVEESQCFLRLTLPEPEIT